MYFDIATIEILQNYFAKLHGLCNGNQHKNDSVLICFDTPLYDSETVCFRVKPEARAI